MGTTTMLVLGGLSTAVSAAQAYSSALSHKNFLENQAAYARHQSRQATENAAAEYEQGRLDRKQGYDSALAQRRETAARIGTQRARQGASGTLADTGGNLDALLDTAEQGEIQALSLQQKGLERDYAHRIAARNDENTASALGARADAYDDAASAVQPWLYASLPLINGAMRAGSAYDSLMGKSRVQNTAGGGSVQRGFVRV